MNSLVEIVDALAQGRYSESYMIRDQQGKVWKKKKTKESFHWVRVDLPEPVEKLKVQVETGPPCSKNPQHSKEVLFEQMKEMKKDDFYENEILCLSELVTDKDFAPVIHIKKFTK